MGESAHHGSIQHQLHPGTSVEFQGVVTSATADPNLWNNEDNADTSVVRFANLSVDKDDAPDPVTAGELVTYTIYVYNFGPSDARAVEFNDRLPPGLTVESISSSGAGDVCGGTTCQFGTIVATVGAGGYRVVTLVARVGAGVTGTITNTAVVDSVDNGYQQPAQDTVTTQVVARAALSITKVALNDPAFAGGVALYQIVVTNEGPSDARNVVVTDTLPVSTTYAGGDAACSASGQTVTCEIGALAAGATRTLLVQANVDSLAVDGLILTNVVTATSPTATQPVTDVVTSTVRQPSGGDADLVISKHAADTVIAGEEITYTVVVTNRGPATATAVSVVDALPGGVSLVRVTSSQGVCESGVSCQLGSLALNATATITVVGLVASDVTTGTELVNVTRVDAANGDPVSGNNQTSVTTTVETLANLSIGKSATPSPAVPGEMLTYQIVVTNSGPSDAVGVQVTDTLPAGFTGSSISSSQGGCAAFPCTLGTLPAGGVVRITIVGSVASSVTMDLVNRAGVTSTTPGASDSVVLTTTVNPSADLSLVLHSTPTTIAGTTALVTATVTNVGPSDAQGAVVTITLPSGATYNSNTLPAGWSVASSAGTSVVLTTSNPFTAGTTVVLPVTVNITTSVASGASLEFQGVVASDTADDDPSNNNDNADTSVLREAELRISKTSDPATVNAGELVTYTITITNEGPSDARFVDVKEQLPGGLTLQSITASDDGACAGTLCQFGTVPDDASRTVTVVALVGSDVTGVVTNTAAVDSVDNVAGLPVSTTATTTINANAALTISKVALNDPAYAGGVALYQIVVVNEGPSDARNVVVTDTLPVSTTYAGGDAVCSASGQTVTCEIGALAAGASRTLLVQANVDSLAADGLTLTNVVTATSPTATTPVTDVVTSTVRQPSGGDADLVISKHAADTVVAGEEITYTLVVTNRGPATATAVSVVDALPGGVSLVGVTSSQGVCESGVSCQLGSLALNATATITVVGLVASDVATGTDLVNVARVDAANRDPVSGNNQTSVTTTVETSANLSIAKSASPTPAVPGATLTYQLVITNAGPSDAVDVQVTETLPAGFNPTNISSSQGGCAAFPCTLGTLPAGSVARITVVGSVAASVTTNLVNRAGVTSTTPGESGSVLLTTPVSPTADLALVLHSTPTTIAGTTAIVTATVTNVGPSDAQGAVVSITLPGGATYNTSALPAGWSVASSAGTTVVLTTSHPFTAGTTVVLPVTVKITASVPSGTSLEFQGVVASDTADSDPLNNSDNADTSVLREAELRISKTSTPATVNAGELVTYTITITNEGPSDARFVDVKEQLPGGLTLQSITASDDGACAGTLCQFGTVTQHATRTITVVALVGSDVTGVVTNTAAVDSIDNVNGLPVSTTATTTVTASAVLTISKVALNNPAYAGGVALYQLVVTNDGPSDAQNVVVTDTLPVSTTYAGGDAACSATGSTVVCIVGALAAGATRTLLVQANVNSLAADGLTLTNVVTATSPTAATPVTDVVTSTVRQPSGGDADLVISKHAADTVIAGEEITYTLVVTNRGPATATAVSIVDALPGGVSLVRVTSSQGLCESGVSCQLGNLALNATATITAVGLVASDVATGTDLVNVARVDAANRDPVSGNNQTSVTTTVETSANLSIAKSASPTTAVPGEQLTYQIVVTNSGPSDAVGVTVTDTLPGGFNVSLVSATQGGCSSLPCTLGTLPAGGVVRITIVGSVAASVTTNLVNRAGVTSTTPGESDSVVLTTTVSTSADLSIFLASTPTAIAGESVRVTAIVSNAGPSDAQGTVITLTLPEGTRLAGSLLPAGWYTTSIGSDTIVLTTSNTFTAGTWVSLPITVAFNTNFIPGTSVEFQGVVTSATADPNLWNNEDNADTSVVRFANLSVDKDDAPDPVTAGELVTYTIYVYNFGPSDARAVEFNDRLPPGLTVESISSSGAGDVCGGTTCQFGTIVATVGAGGYRIVTLVARVGAGITGTITNTAVVDSVDNGYQQPAQDTVTTQVVARAALSITKVALNDPAYAGGVALYQIVVTNEGPSDAQNVVVTDTLPVSTTYAGGDAACSAVGQTVTCEIGALAAGATRTLLVQANVDSLAADGLTLTNVVTATSPTATTPVTDVVTSTVRQPSGGDADLVISKHAADTVIAGEEITYTLVVTNRGPATATVVSVVDALPGGVSLVRVTSIQGVCESAVSCQLGSLALNATATITVVGLVASDVTTGTALVNVARVDAANRDPVGANNQTSVTTTVETAANLSISKSATPSPAVPGEMLTYQIVVTNSGPSDAVGVQVTDTLPAGFTGSSISSSQGGCSSLPCTLGTLPAGGVVRITIVGSVESSVTTDLVNRAGVTSATPGAGDSVVLTTTVNPSADLLLVLHSTPTTIAGTTAIVTATVTNVGPSDAQGAVVTITLPSEASYDSSTLPAGWNVASSAGTTVVLTTSNPFTAGTTVILPVTVKITASAPSGASLEFQGVVASDTADNNLLNNSDNADTSVLREAELRISKTSTPATVNAGELVTYTITITNEGPSAARFVDVKEQLPSGLTLQSITASNGGACAGTLCQFGTVAYTSTRTITVVALVGSDVTGVVTNTAAVDSVDNVNGLPVSTTATTTITASAVLTISKVALNNPAYAGGVALYQIVVTNEGPSDAQNVVVTDTLPVSTTYAGGDAACSAVGQTVTCEIGTLAAGATRTLLVQANVDSLAADGLTLTNIVTATSPTATTPVTDVVTSTVRQPSGGDADLVISKYAADTVVAGEEITYTLVVTNSGPATATAVSVVDALPGGVSLVRVTSSQGVCESGVSCQLGSLALNATAIITVVGIVDSGVLTGSSLVNVARVDAANRDPVSGNNQTSVTTTVETLANLSIGKSATPSPAVPGEQLTYQIVVTNSGPSDAVGVQVTDTLPGGFTWSSISSSQGGCSSLPCTLGTLPAGGVVRITIVGSVAASVTTDLVNRAGVTSTTPGESGSVMLTTPVSPTADLALVLNSTPTTIAGTTALVTATVTNVGPSDAQGAVVSITLPGGATYNTSALPACWSVASSAGTTVVLTTSTPFTAGTSVVLPVTVNITASAPSGMSLEFQGLVDSNTADSDPSNNSDNADTSVLREAELRISKTSDPATVNAGELVTYTITITNEGPSDARFVDVKEQLPSGLTLQSITASNGGACAGTLCQFGTVPDGASRTVTVVALVGSDVTGVVTNTAAVDSEDNIAGLPVSTTATTTINASAVLSISKVALNDPAYAGGVALYQIVVTNEGPSDARNVVVTDTLPVSTTFAGGDAACGATGSTVICIVGALAAGATRTLLVQANVNSLAADGLTLTNMVTATSPTATTPVTDVVTSTVRQPSGGDADLVISKHAADTVVAGEEITYTLVVTNRGPATATAVSIVDALPGGVSLVRVTSSQGVCKSGVSCQLGSLALNVTATITVVGLVASDVTTGTPLVNVTRVDAANRDPVSGNNQASITTTVATAANLSIGKSASPTTAVPGEQLTYVLVITNSGPSDALGVQVTDTLPGGFTTTDISSSQGGCSSFPCTLGTLPAGGVAHITIVGSVAASVTTDLVNRAGVTSTTPGKSDSVVLTTTVNPSADLSLVLNSTPTTIAGTTALVTATVTNIGPSDAQGAVVTITLPSGASYDSNTLPAGWSVASSAGTSVVLTTSNPFTAGTSVVLPVTVNVDADVPSGQSLEFVGVVASATADGNPSNNSDNADTSVLREAELRISKTSTPAAVNAGELVTYTITITNEGPSDARFVDVKEQLPSGLTLQSITASNGGACAGTLCQFGTVTQHATRTITVVALVGSDVTGVVTNTAAADSVDNVAGLPVSTTATTTVSASAILSITKVALNDPAYAGGVALYQIVVTNEGPSDAQNVVVTDTLPVSTTYAGGDAACSAVGQTVTCEIGTLAAGATRTLLVQANVNSLAADGLTLTNIVTATSPTATTPVTDVVTSTVRQPSGGDADLVISKYAADIVVAGEEITYTLVVTNSGPATATAVSVVDALPGGVSLVRVTSSQGLCESGVSCQLGSLALNATAVITVVGLVDSGVLTGSSLVNVARIDAANRDPVSGNNQTSVTTTVETSANLSIAKSASPTPAVPGATLTYQLVITNAGPSDAVDVQVTETLPAGFTWSSISSSQGGCAAFPCTLGTLPAGGVASITIVGSVASSVTTDLVNRAGVTSTTPGAGDSVVLTTTVSPSADLSLVLHSTPTTVAGTMAVVTATVTNVGPSDAQNTAVTMTLPADATFINANLPVGWFAADNGDGTVTLTTTNVLAPDETVLLPVTVDIAPGVIPGSSLEFQGVVASATSDPDLSNNTDDADTSIVSQAELGISKTSNPATVNAGEVVTYTITIVNVGPSDARFVDVKEQLPSGLTLQSISASDDGACAGTLCQFGTVAADDSRTVIVVARVGSDVTGVVTNTAAVDSVDNAAGLPVSTMATTTVKASAILSITKVALNAPVYAGGLIHYQLVVANAGSSDAPNVVITDTLPVSTTYAGGDATCSANGNTVVCAIGTLAAGANRTLMVLATVSVSLTNNTRLTNTATVSSPVAITPVTATATVTVLQPTGGLVNLAIDKTGPASAAAGDYVTYTLVITNSGPAIATNVQVVDALPFEIEARSVASTQGVCNNGIACQLGDLAVGSVAVITITGFVRTDAISGTVINNVANVSSNNPDANPEDNADLHTHIIEAVAKLQIEKSAQPDTVAPGGALTYRIIVRNLGPAVARSVVVTDLFPSQVVAPLFTSARGYCEQYTCFLGDVPVGENVTLLVIASVADTASGIFTNTATLTTTTALHPDSVITAEVGTQVSDTADLVMIKQATPSAFAGSTFSYVLTVRNLGPSAALNVQIADTLPNDVEGCRCRRLSVQCA
jgi:uncharacterized repeat protein (TIGR01451 family)